MRRPLLAVVALYVLVHATAASADPLADAVADASEVTGLPRSWIEAVIAEESGGRLDAVSPRGAMGLMQLMPATWAELRARLGLGPDPFDLRDNVMAGAVYLADLYARFGASGFLAAYNAGPARYADTLTRGRPLPVETRTYVARMNRRLGSGGSLVQPERAWRAAPLFPPTGEPLEGGAEAAGTSGPSRHATSRGLLPPASGANQ